MPEKISTKTSSVLQIFLLLFCTTLFSALTLPSAFVIAEPLGKTSLCNNAIGSLQTNTVKVSISSCNFGLTYTVQTHDGEMLAENIALSDFIASFPDLAKNIENGLAANDARLMVLD
ncbi:MAG: hypothetical protein MJE63_31610 [Proteobacteria bacterium]|nr:hypothetical protein [Pseudomonadota bacterium]